MQQPEVLKTEAELPWSRGRGVDVWAILEAAAQGRMTEVQSLVARDARLLECELDYRRPLRFAVLGGQREVAAWLLDQGADPTYGFSRETLLDLVRLRGSQSMSDWLAGELAARYGICPEGERLAAMIREGKGAEVRAAVERNPEWIHAADSFGNPPLFWAVMTRRLPLVEWLLARGATPNHRRPDGARALDLVNGDYHFRGWRDVPETALRPPALVAGHLIACGAD